MNDAMENEHDDDIFKNRKRETMKSFLFLPFISGNRSEQRVTYMGLNDYTPKTQ
jgi:hypothetical protein